MPAGSIVSLSSASAETVAPEGYTLIGWDENSSPEVAPTFGINDTFELQRDMTLYAIYSPIVNYTISFDTTTNGGSGAVNPITVQSGTTTTLTGTDTNVVAPQGKVFIGWSENSWDTNANYRVEDLDTPVEFTASKTLYALYGNSTNEYQVTFNATTNGGSGNSEFIAYDGALVNIWYAASEKVIPPEGYALAGWDADSTATTPTYPASGITIEITNTTTLYAIYQEIVYYTYTFDTTTNGGSGTVNPITVQSGQTFSLVGTETNVVAPQDKVFVGWALNSNATGVDYKVTEFEEYGDTVSISGDATLYAIYGNSTDDCVVSIDASTNGGTGDTDLYVYDGVILDMEPISNTIEAPVGYTLIGWDENSTATTPTYSTTDTVSITGDITLYAIYAVQQ